MSGTYHFIRAEQLLRRLEDLHPGTPEADTALALAQIHATLAAAAPALFPAEHLEHQVSRELADHAAAAAETTALAS